MSDCLIVLNKRIDVIPVGARETWQYIFTKCVLRVTGIEATNECQDDQFCDSLNTGIDRAVHGVQDIWDAN